MPFACIERRTTFWDKTRASILMRLLVPLSLHNKLGQAFESRAEKRESLWIYSCGKSNYCIYTILATIFRLRQGRE
jgi:hypothetical protein